MGKLIQFDEHISQMGGSATNWIILGSHSPTPLVLLMEKIPNNHLTCMKLCKQMGCLPYQLVQDLFFSINSISQLECKKIPRPTKPTLQDLSKASKELFGTPKGYPEMGRRWLANLGVKWMQRWNQNGHLKKCVPVHAPGSDVVFEDVFTFKESNKLITEDSI